MQDVTAAFLTEVTGSHVAVVVAEIWSGSTKLATLYPNDGSVSVDARRAIRRSCSFTVIDVDGTLNPRNDSSVLSPYSANEIRMFRGVKYASGSTEVVPLGVFRIAQVSIERGEDGVMLSVSGEDRGRVMQRRKWSNAYNIPASSNYATVINNIVQDRISGVAQSLTATSYASPSTGTKVLGVGNESDPMADVIAIAEAIGQEAYFAADGTFTTSPIPSLTTSSPVLTVSDDDTSVMLSITDEMGTDSIYNGVIAKAEGSHLIVPLTDARVWDDDAQSPTNRSGALGERPYEWSSSWVVTQTQLNDVAYSIFQNYRGESVSFTMVPNPALDVRDVIRVQSSLTGLDSLAVIDTLEIPLSVDGAMTVTARVRGY